MGQWQVEIRTSPVRVWECLTLASERKKWWDSAGDAEPELREPYVRFRFAGAEFRLRVGPRGTRVEVSAEGDWTERLRLLKKVSEESGAWPSSGMVGEEGGATS